MEESQDKFPTFEMLFDLEEIQEIQDSFAKTLGVASIITDPRGNPITRPSNFCRLCKDIIRKTKIGFENCRKSDAVIGQCSTGSPITRQCLSCGLWDSGVSMVVSGHHIGTWLIGQVRDEAFDSQVMASYARTIGVDEARFLKALDEVPIMSLAQFKQTGKTLYLIANQLSNQAYQKFNQERIVAEKKRTEQVLLKQNEYLAALHETSLGIFSRRKLDHVLSSIINRASKLTGAPNGMVYLYDPGRKKLKVRATCGKFASLAGKDLSTEEGICGSVWETGESIIVNDYKAWPKKNQQYDLSYITSAIGVPLTSGSQIEGGINLCHHEPGRAFTQETTHILEQFAELATLATDNAKLFENLNKELDQRIRLEAEQKEMEARLWQSQKMEAIGTLAGGIAHDFNNILFPVMGYSEMLLNDIPEDDPMHDQIQTILNGAFRAKDLVNQILTFSRQAEHRPSALKVHLILKEVIKFARASLPSTIKIKEEISKDAGKIMADPTMIHQLTMNLITNALHAMEPNGGTLTARLFEQDIQPGLEPLPDMVSGVYVCLEVADTGCGMDSDTMQRMFEPYFTSKPQGKGTGLGLSVVHGIVKNLGGNIKVASQEGMGSSFYVYLPVMDKKRLGQKEKLSPGVHLHGHERILLVDDEKPVLKMLDQMLGKAGYNVTLKDCGLEALAHFQKYPHDFDIMITDMTMPDMTGENLILQIKKIRPDLPVILITGFSEKIAGERTCGVSPDKILMKPVGKSDLLASLRLLLQKR